MGYSCGSIKSAGSVLLAGVEKEVVLSFVYLDLTLDQEKKKYI